MADKDWDELTIPQEKLVRDVASIAAEQQVTKALRRVWQGMIGVIVTILLQSLYLAYETGVHLDRQDNNYQQIQVLTAEVQQIQGARTLDATQAAATNATLNQMQIQLERIENKVDHGN